MNTIVHPQVREMRRRRTAALRFEPQLSGYRDPLDDLNGSRPTPSGRLCRESILAARAHLDSAGLNGELSDAIFRSFWGRAA